MDIRGLAMDDGVKAFDVRRCSVKPALAAAWPDLIQVADGTRHVCLLVLRIVRCLSILVVPVNKSALSGLSLQDAEEFVQDSANVCRAFLVDQGLSGLQDAAEFVQDAAEFAQKDLQVGLTGESPMKPPAK